MACKRLESRVVIYDMETGGQHVIEFRKPWKCTVSQYCLAFATYEDGLHLFAHDGELVRILPDSIDASCVAFHPRNANILAIGYGDGTVRMWDVSTQAYVSEFKQHTRLTTNIRFAPDYRLFLSSMDNNASIVSLDDQFQIVSSVKFEGHTNCVNDILPLPSLNQCVTCSNDTTLKVWDCETGACLRTLTEHTRYVGSLALHSNGQFFASGAFDKSVIVWSSDTFEVLRRITFLQEVDSLVFDGANTLYVALYDHGVLSCNYLSGEVGPVIIPGTHDMPGLVFGTSSYNSVHLFNSHTNFAYHSTCDQALDFIHTCTVALACTTHCAHGFGGAVEGARSGTNDAGAIRARGDHSALCAVARTPSLSNFPFLFFL